MLKFVENLLQGAPVEWKKLGEICDFRHGFSFKASLFKKVGDPVIRIMNIHDDRVILENLAYFDRTDYTTDLAPWRVQKGDILIAMSGATTGKIGFVDDDIPAYINQRVGKFIPNRACLNNRYLFYFLANEMQTIYEMAHGGAQPNLSSSALLDNLLIPLPPLHIQGKIVAVLDKFTALERELETKLGTEFVLRRKQYEYYRNKLLTFGEEVERKRLGEIVAIKRGKRLVKKELVRSGNFAVFQNSMTPLGFYNESNVNADTTFIICAGSAGEIGYSHLPFWAADDVCYFTPNDILSSKYLYYILLNKKNTIKSQVRRVIIPRLPRAVLEDFIIPLPPLSEQARIVSILDKFDTLVNSLSEGLPREIALRHKQYEYYRDALLTFPQAM